jgi:hypothetical protein
MRGRFTVEAIFTAIDRMTADHVRNVGDVDPKVEIMAHNDSGKARASRYRGRVSLGS